MTETSRFRVFISYSHGDEEYRVELEKHLALLRNQGVLSIWQDRLITVGDEFDKVIASELDAADIILLLVSVNFLASKYCWEIEQTRALERHEAGDAKVIPIILKHCDNWQSAPFGKLTAAPTDGMPIEDFSSWDKGFTDVTKAIRLAATQLRTKREAKHQPQVNEPAPGWNVPFGRNVNFTGRVELLERLHRDLMLDDRAALTALSGLGGIGKTQTAIEYAYRHREDYKLVWWLRAEEPATLAADFAALAGPLLLDVSGDQNQAVAAVLGRLDEVGDWLLIFDNAPDADSVRGYLPLQRRGRVMITSRDPNWEAIAKPVRVGVMGVEDAVKLLLLHRSESERDDAKELAEALGFLPLALAQARAYAEHVGCTLKAYLDLLKEREADLLAQPYKPEGYDVPVAAAWDLAFETIEATPGAADLLNLLAFLAPDAFPKNLLTEHADELQDNLAAIARDPFKLNAAIAALRRASLVETTDDTLSTHRLVQAITRNRCRCRAADAGPGVGGKAVRLIRAALPPGPNDVLQWPVYARLLAHAVAASGHAERLEENLEVTGSILNEIALYLNSRAAYDEALPLFQRAIAIGEKALGPDNPNLATMLNNLALLHKQQGRYDEALPLFRRAIEILKSGHPNFPMALNNLAELHSEQERYDKALPLYQRAIAIGEKNLGPDHPDLAVWLNNLANLHREQGRYNEALPLFQRAIAIGKKTLGPNHPVLAVWLNNLANLHRDQGRYDEPLSLYQRAIAIGKKTLGPDHPDLAISLHNLAILHRDQRCYDEALPLFERALSIFEAKLPPEHPNTQTVRNNYETCKRYADENHTDK